MARILEPLHSCFDPYSGFERHWSSSSRSFTVTMFLDLSSVAHKHNYPVPNLSGLGPLLPLPPHISKSHDPTFNGVNVYLICVFNGDLSPSPLFRNTASSVPLSTALPFYHSSLLSIKQATAGQRLEKLNRPESST